MLDVAALIGIMALFVGLFFLACYLGSIDTREEQEEYVRLNKGHHVWCQAGAEKIPYCTCISPPAFFTSRDIAKRKEMIRWAADGMIKRKEVGE